MSTSIVDDTRSSAPLPMADRLWGLRDVLLDPAPDPAPGSGHGLPVALLRELMAAIPCDMVSCNGMDSARRMHRFGQEVTDDGVLETGPDSPDPDEDVFWEHYWATPMCSYPDRTGDLTSVLLSSDFGSARQLRATPMHVDYLSQFGGPDGMMLVLPDGGPGRTVRLILSRASGPAFDERDRFLLQLLRPHLWATYRRLRWHTSGAKALTRRQCDVLALVRDGATNTAIAHRLGISEGTVRTHLQNAYATLGVSSRTAAVVAAADLL